MSHFKICFKCGKEQPLGCFYPHSQMKDGHLNKCKDCAKKDVRAAREANPEHYKEYDAQRQKQPERRLKKQEYVKGWRDRNKEKQKAHNLVNNALRDKKIEKSSCFHCGDKNTHAHHEDYTKPLEIVWLCPFCHKQRHKQLDQEYPYV